MYTVQSFALICLSNCDSTCKHSFFFQKRYILHVDYINLLEMMVSPALARTLATGMSPMDMVDMDMVAVTTDMIVMVMMVTVATKSVIHLHSGTHSYLL